MKKFYVRARGDAKVVGMFEATTLADAQALAAARYYEDIDVTDHAPECLPDWLGWASNDNEDRANFREAVNNTGWKFDPDLIPHIAITLWGWGGGSDNAEYLTGEEAAALLITLAKLRGYQVPTRVEAGLLSDATTMHEADIACVNLWLARIDAEKRQKSVNGTGGALRQACAEAISTLHAVSERAGTEAFNHGDRAIVAIAAGFAAIERSARASEVA